MIVEKFGAARWALCGVLVGAATSAQAQQQVFIYPSMGQTPQQQQTDKTECSAWASQATGFDALQVLEQQQAMSAQVQRESQQVQQSTARDTNSAAPAIGTVGGAAGGAAIGAIAGNAGKGAAIGAVTGLLGGTIASAKAKSTAAQQKQQEQQQIAAQQARQNATTQQKLADYDRAINACMQGRGYTVK